MPDDQESLATASQADSTESIESPIPTPTPDPSTPSIRAVTTRLASSQSRGRSTTPRPFVPMGEGRKRMRSTRSFVWDHGDRVVVDKIAFFHCRLCIDDKRENPAVISTKDGTTNARRHLAASILLGGHDIVEFPGDEPDDEPSTIPTIQSMVLTGTRQNQFLPVIFRQKLLRFIAVCHIPFSIVENAAFRDLMLYSSPHLRGDDSLTKSGTVIKTWLLELFITSQAILIAFLLSCNTQIHVSFDLWTSPNNYSMVGIVCHFIDNQFKARTVLLGLKRVFGPHAGENMAPVLIQVLEQYRLLDRLGYCVLDNASDNDTTLRYIERSLAKRNIIWDAELHRLRCFGHIVSLIVNAFTDNKPLFRDRRHGDMKNFKRPFDALSKLHNIVKYIQGSTQRIDKFKDINLSLHSLILQPIQDNDTRWFSKYIMLIRAIEIRQSLEIFISRYITTKEIEKDPAEYQMSQDDWLYCSDVIAFMKPFYLLCKELEGKSDTGKISLILSY